MNLIILSVAFGIIFGVVFGVLITSLPLTYLLASIIILASLIFYFKLTIQSYFNSVLMKVMLESIFNKDREQHDKKNNLILNETKTIATISYTYNDKEYKVYLPYDAINARVRSKCVYAQFETKAPIDPDQILDISEGQEGQEGQEAREGQEGQEAREGQERQEWDRQEEQDILANIKKINQIEEINITQQPGIPYCVTCHDFNAQTIEIRLRDQTVLKNYYENEKIIL